MAVRGIALDTNAYSALLKGQPEALEIVRHTPAIGVSIVVLGELLAGFAHGSRYATNLERLEQFLSSERVKVFQPDRGIADYYATIYTKLRRRGRMIPTNDIWIAATALRYDLAVFTYDPHFQNVDDLVAVQRLDEFLAAF